MVLHMKVNSLKVNDTVKGLSNGMMAESIRVITLIISEKVLEKWNFVMVLHMKVNS